MSQDNTKSNYPQARCTIPMPIQYYMLVKGGFKASEATVLGITSIFINACRLGCIEDRQKLEFVTQFSHSDEESMQ